MGGLLVHGIPEFRLPRNTIQEAIQKVLDLGVKVELNREIGKNLELDELEREYEAILLAF